MSDILIRGMEMPTEGGTIVVYKISGNYFAARAGKDELCPLVPVPPHGDLIDRDYVKEHLYACETNGRPLHKLELCELLDAINDIPTIIPAEEGET